MRLKDDSVSIRQMSPQLLFGLQCIDSYFILNYKIEIFITSGDEPTTRHSYSSCHYDGNAADIRTKHLFIDGTKDERKKDLEHLIRILKQRLGYDFDVILENVNETNEHMHIEWQPKRRDN